MHNSFLKEISNWSIEKNLNFNRGNLRHSSEPSTRDNQRSHFKGMSMFIDVAMVTAHTSAKLSKNQSLFC